jgi:phospholipid-binding lipoprotein MlaA
MTRLRPLWLALSCLLGACAHSPVDDPQDPLEPLNRASFAFNQKLDKYVARPVARAYVHVLPAPMRTGVDNFLKNLASPTVVINDALQGKFVQARDDTGRFLLNSTFGLAGFLDPATLVGLERHDEDFGQTFGFWGIGQGWYLMLPLLGPSTNRDLVGRVAGAGTSVNWYLPTEDSLPLTAADILNTRSQLLGSEHLLDEQFDPYLFVRGAYLQRRQNLVYDGNPPKEQIDWGDDDKDSK